MSVQSSTESVRPHAKATQTAARTVLVLVVGIVLGGLSVSISSKSSHSDLWSHLWSAVTHRSLYVDVTQPTVVNQIQQLRRLETVVYTMDKVVTGERENPILPDFLTGDRLLLLVHGEVVAGIDFANLRSSDVKVDGKQVRLHLPEAQVFSTRLDSERTRVYSRQTGLLVPTDPNLETQVRQEAEREIQASALNDGILHNAQQNAGATITSLLQGLGFEKIEFD
jgi:Protein of unknown function (DUF4230)